MNRLIFNFPAEEQSTAKVNLGLLELELGRPLSLAKVARTLFREFNKREAVYEAVKLAIKENSDGD